MGLNHRQDVAVCWWSLVEPDEELWPWTHTDVQRRNLVLLSCSATDELKVKLTHIIINKSIRLKTTDTTKWCSSMNDTCASMNETSL